MIITITIEGDNALISAPKDAKAIQVLSYLQCIEEDLTNKFNDHMEEIAERLNITDKPSFDIECDKVLYSEITKS